MSIKSPIIFIVSLWNVISRLQRRIVRDWFEVFDWRVDESLYDTCIHSCISSLCYIRSTCMVFTISIFSHVICLDFVPSLLCQPFWLLNVTIPQSYSSSRVSLSAMRFKQSNNTYQLDRTWNKDKHGSFGKQSPRWTSEQRRRHITSPKLCI